MREPTSSKSVLEGTAFVLGANVLGAAVGFATSALIARKLDVGQFGDFSLTLAIFGVVLLFSGMGVSTEASRLVAKFEAAGNKRYVLSAISSAAIVTLATALAAGALLFGSAGALSWLFKKNLAANLGITAPMVVFAGFMALILALLQGFRRFVQHSSLVSFNNLSKLGFVYLLIGFGAGGALYGILFAYVATVALGLYLLRKEFLVFGGRPYPYGNLLRQGIPIFASSFFIFLGARASMYLTGFFSGSEEVGIYSAALMFSQAFFMLPDAIATALFPALTGMHGRDGRFSAFLSHSLKLGSLIAFPVLIYTGIFAPEIVRILLGRSYAQSAMILRIMILTGMAYFFYSILTTTILSSGRQRSLVGISAAGFLLILAAGSFLIPRYGAYGAALADVAGYALMALLAFRAVRKFTRCPPPREFFGAILSNVLLGAVLLYAYPASGSAWALAAISITGAALYIGAITLSGVLTAEEIAIIRSVLGPYKRK